jgi:CRP-like cAMP-binding protein
MDVSVTDNPLSSTAVFSALGPDDLDRVASIAATKRFAKGEQLFAEGDEALGFFLVVSGKIRVYKLSRDGKEQTLHLIGPGGSFAEGALFDETTYPASAEALSDSEVVFLPRAEFVALCRRRPDLSLAMLQSLSRYLRRLTVVIEDIALRSAPSRLAAFVVSQVVGSRLPLSDGVAFDLDIKKSELASLLGIAPETLSRAIASLESKGAIRVSDYRFEVTNVAALQDAATKT